MAGRDKKAERKDLLWFTPGPVPVAERTLEALARQPVHHRSGHMHRLMGRVLDDLKWLFRTRETAFVATCSGSALMEAALRNCVRERVLCLINGTLGQRWYQMARANGLAAEPLHFDSGQPVDPQIVAEHMASHRYDAVTVLHVETSTGVQNPIEAIATVVNMHKETLLLVDAVSSLLTTELDFDALRLDFAFTSSQKALALPPGLALFACSKRLLERARRIRRRGYYLDFLRFRDYAALKETPNTPAVNLIYALATRLASLREKGHGAEIRRHQEMAEWARDWACKRFALYPNERFAANSLTVIRNTLNISVSALNRFLEKRGFRVADGHGDLKGVTFRISHMGAVDLSALRSLLAAIDEFLESPSEKPPETPAESP